MNESEDKHSETNKSSASFFAELLSSNSSKISQRLNADFALYLTIVNFRILHQILKKMYKGSDREPTIDALPNEITETWRQSVNEEFKAAAKVYEDQISQNGIGKIMKSVIQNPKELLKAQMIVASRVANMFRELMTKKISFDSLKSGE